MNDVSDVLIYIRQRSCTNTSNRLIITSFLFVSLVLVGLVTSSIVWDVVVVVFVFLWWVKLVPIQVAG